MSTEQETTTTGAATNGSGKASKKAVNAPRREYFMMDPNKLVVVGKDTDDGPDHPLYDERIKLSLDEGMVLNIMAYGVLKPIFVQKEGEQVYVVDGRRRVLHARLANERLASKGEETVLVPVIFKRGDEATLFGISRSANAMNAVDSPLTNARNAQRLLDMGKEVAEIAVIYGVKQQTIKDWLALLDLSAMVRKAVEQGEVSVSAGATLAKLPKEEQEKHLEELRAEGVKPTVDRVIHKARVAKGKEGHFTPRQRLAKARDILLKLGATDATKDELINGLDKISKALFSKGWDKLVAEAEKAAAEDAE